VVFDIFGTLSLLGLNLLLSAAPWTEILEPLGALPPIVLGIVFFNLSGVVVIAAFATEFLDALGTLTFAALWAATFDVLGTLFLVGLNPPLLVALGIDPLNPFGVAELVTSGAVPFDLLAVLIPVPEMALFDALGVFVLAVLDIVLLEPFGVLIPVLRILFDALGMFILVLFWVLFVVINPLLVTLGVPLIRNAGTTFTGSFCDVTNSILRGLVP